MDQVTGAIEQLSVAVTGSVASSHQSNKNVLAREMRENSTRFVEAAARAAADAAAETMESVGAAANQQPMLLSIAAPQGGPLVDQSQQIGYRTATYETEAARSNRTYNQYSEVQQKHTSAMTDSGATAVMETQKTSGPLLGQTRGSIVVSNTERGAAPTVGGGSTVVSTERGAAYTTGGGPVISTTDRGAAYTTGGSSTVISTTERGAAYTTGGSSTVISTTERGAGYTTGGGAAYTTGGGAAYTTGGGAAYTIAGGAAYTTGGATTTSTTTGEQRTEQTRKVSTCVIESVSLEQPPEDKVSVVDVVTYEEQVTYVPVKETREIEKKVVVPVVKVVERVKEVAPPPKYVKREVPEYYDVVVEERVPVVEERVVTKVVEKPVIKYVEVKKEVPQYEYYDVEESVYCDRPIHVTKYVDEEVPVIISQTVKPVITESANSFLDVNVIDYEPEVIPVDVHVAKPVATSFRACAESAMQTRHKLVNITSAQYNTILRKLNTHLDQNARAQLPFVAENNMVNFVADSEGQFIVAPSGIQVEGYKLRQPPAGQTRQLIGGASGLPPLGMGSASPLSVTMHQRNMQSSAVSQDNVSLAVEEAVRKRDARICCQTRVTPSSSGIAADMNSYRSSESSVLKRIAPTHASVGMPATQTTTTLTNMDPLGAVNATSNTRLLGGAAAGVEAAILGASSSGSSQRIDTVHSYKSMDRHAAAVRRNRVCC